MLPEYIGELYTQKALDSKSLQIGLSRFLIVLPNLAPDVPKLAEWFSLVLLKLHELSAVQFRDVNWTDKGKIDADDVPMVEDYFRLVAYFLYNFQVKGKASTEGLKSFMAVSGFSAQLAAFEKDILEEGLFDEIRETFTEKFGDAKKAQILVHLLKNDVEGLQRDINA